MAVETLRRRWFGTEVSSFDPAMFDPAVHVVNPFAGSDSRVKDRLRIRQLRCYE